MTLPLGETPPLFPENPTQSTEKIIEFPEFWWSNPPKKDGITIPFMRRHYDIQRNGNTVVVVPQPEPEQTLEEKLAPLIIDAATEEKPPDRVIRRAKNIFSRRKGDWLKAIAAIIVPAFWLRFQLLDNLAIWTQIHHFRF